MSFVGAQLKFMEMASQTKKDRPSVGKKIHVPVVRKQMFKSDYTRKYNFIVSSNKSVHYARCTICGVDFSIAHGGMNDIDGSRGHVNSAKHKMAAKACAGSQSLMKFTSKPDYSVIKAETLMVIFIIEHNLPFSVSDHLSDLIKNILTMFTDGKAAASFSCKRTKSTAIARTLGQETKGELEI